MHVGGRRILTDSWAGAARVMYVQMRAHVGPTSAASCLSNGPAAVVGERLRVWETSEYAIGPEPRASMEMRQRHWFRCYVILVAISAMNGGSGIQRGTLLAISRYTLEAWNGPWNACSCARGL